MIPRTLFSQIKGRLNSQKSIILIGPRQVGKTTLIKEVLKDKPFLWLNADDPTVRKALSNPNTEQLKTIFGTSDFVFIDEAQRIENSGITLKLIVDELEDVQLIVSGSSAFELGNSLNEPLTGRKWEYLLLPISWNEFQEHVGFIKAEQQLESRILYGMYPDILNSSGDEVELLKQLSDSYLYKDILAFGGIRKPELLEKLVRALAFQIGDEVSYNELSQLIGIDKNTVQNYIQLLEQAYVIFRLPSFSRNLRNEIKTNQKIYFYDTGIRNAVIGNFNLLDDRQDKGQLWENFLIAERIKQIHYNHPLAKAYFWRTTSQQEIDYIEEEAGEIKAVEFKWSAKKNPKIPRKFKETYQPEFTLINRENFREFLKPDF